MKKTIWTSKTFWINIISILAIVIQESTGSLFLDTEMQLKALAMINIILRLVTKEEIVW